MITTTVQHIAQIVQGRVLGSDASINTVTTDNRVIEGHALFVALIGERFDGHDFAKAAVDKGAVALLVSQPVELAATQIVVADTKVALGRLGAWVHQQSDTPTVAITGSCGKTTVKEMTASILQQKGRVLFTAGNFNNDIGVPLTLLRSTPDDDYAVIELGANHVGEIAYTTQLVKPRVALVNNVAAAHLEGFGSLDGVKIAKGEIFQSLQPGDSAIINLDSHGDKLWQRVLDDKKVITFALNNTNADYYASHCTLSEAGIPSFVLHTPVGDINVTLPLIGLHNVSNALAAAALSMCCGATLAEIQHGFHQLTPVKGRVAAEKLTDNVTLIDDSYNASVPAMKAAVDLLAAFGGQRWLILGNMAELGAESLALHRQVGEYAAPLHFEHVLTYGDDCKVISDECQGIHFQSHTEMVNYIEQQLIATSQLHTLLVKGANSAGMWQVVAALKESFS